MRNFASGGFVAQRFEQVRAGPDEGNAETLTSARQGRIFGEETVAGMNGVDFFLGRERDDCVDIQVRLHGTFALADEIRFVGFETVQAEAIFLRIHRDCPEAEFVCGAENADGDFTAVECEKFLHQRYRLQSDMD